MKRGLLSIPALLLSIFFLNSIPATGATSKNRTYLWPTVRNSAKAPLEILMPDKQDHQIAAMYKDAKEPGFNADNNRLPYLEWLDAPKKPNGACMILISGGGYYNLYDSHLITLWNETFTALGFQCVNLVYRTPRPKGIEYYQTAWEDGQRAVRLVRSQARKRGYDPEKIGTISMSAGSHMALLLATNSQTQAYEPVDKYDQIPAHINWAIVNAPAYATTDADGGFRASRDGYGADVALSELFKFDEKTCPMSLHHGGDDIYSPNGSTLIYKELQKRKIPADLHLFPNKPHGAFGLNHAVEFLYQLGIIEPVKPEEALLERYALDTECDTCFRQRVWPEGKVSDDPYIDWYIPKNRTTDAIQIIYSGGAYYGSHPLDFEVAPARRYLVDKGMTVVTLKYRAKGTPGYAQHTAAWQDLQRAIRLVRSQAASFGLDPDKIGIMGSSAGGHLTLMGTTSSLHRSYVPLDDIDKLPCNVAWGIAVYPAYIFDGDGHITSDFSFDLKSCPMFFIHGSADHHPSLGSVELWEKFRSMGIQCELHALATREHCLHRNASPNTGSYNILEHISAYIDYILSTLDN